VSLLVAEVSRLDRESGGELLRDVPAQQVYEGALTVMMRLVFLLYAEEQRLLPSGDELYDASYAVGPLHDELSKAQSLHGDELGDRVEATWPRLLAVFAAIHGGSTHDQLWIPPYGGSLFDPSRFPWLVPAKVTDRVVYEILDALLTLRARKGFKGKERLSYKGLDVEQIGHVYEGLLEYGCHWAEEPYVGVSFGRDRKYEAVLPLARLEEWETAGSLPHARRAGGGGVRDEAGHGGGGAGQVGRGDGRAGDGVRQRPGPGRACGRLLRPVRHGPAGRAEGVAGGLGRHGPLGKSAGHRYPLHAEGAGGGGRRAHSPRCASRRARRRARSRVSGGRRRPRNC
jgi:hypothetical protein